MRDRRSEQRRRNLFGIHPPACTCVDCSRKRSGLPPVSRLPTQPTEEDWEAFTKSLNPTDATQSPSDARSDPGQTDGDDPIVVAPTEPPAEDDDASEQGEGDGAAQSLSDAISNPEQSDDDDPAAVSTTPPPSEESGAPAVVSPTMPPEENGAHEKPLVKRLWDALRRRGRGATCGDLSEGK